jgi:hypothetical protein
MVRFTLCAAVFVSCCGLVVCSRQPHGADALLGERAGTPAPSSDGACRFDLTPQKARTVFYVLGYLYEYVGRTIIEDGELIEELYCDEQGQVGAFRAILTRLAAEQGIDPAIREETRQECLVSFHSREVADRLNSCYRYQLSGESLGQGPDGSYRRLGQGTLALTLFVRHGAGDQRGAVDRDRALPYLAGAWARHGRGGAFVFANSHEKATRIAQLLTMLGCRDVKLESNFGFIPQTNTLRFTPTGEVTEQVVRGKW